MISLKIKRAKQVCTYGKQHAKELAKSHNTAWFPIFLDIVSCFRRYKMWSNQYVKEGFYHLNKEERTRLGMKYRVEGIQRDEWQKDFTANRRFLAKYTSRKYELPQLREKRNKAYAKRYGMGKNCVVEYNVELSRQHYLPGTITIGDNIIFAKNVFIDYSGFVKIKNNVRIGNGVVIESHYAGYHKDYTQPQSAQFQTSLVIEEDALIGTRAIIMSSCHYIGKHARIGTGAVVTTDIPDYATAVGVPAKVIRYANPENQPR